MRAMTFTRSFLTFCLVTTAFCSDCRVLYSAQSSAPPVANEKLVLVSAAGQSCSDLCGDPLHFQTPYPTAEKSYACQAETEAGAAFGYQLGSSPSCNFASGDVAVNATEYQCLCLGAGQTQGLDLPGASNSCTDSCLSSIDGMTGSTVNSGSSFACLALSEIGTTNRFGHTTGTSCAFVNESAVDNTEDFSCACIFSLPYSPPFETSVALQNTNRQLGSATAG